MESYGRRLRAKIGREDRVANRPPMPIDKKEAVAVAGKRCEECLKSAPAGVAARRTGVRTIAVIPYRARK